MRQGRLLEEDLAGSSVLENPRVSFGHVALERPTGNPNEYAEKTGGYTGLNTVRSFLSLLNTICKDPTYV